VKGLLRSIFSSFGRSLFTKFTLAFIVVGLLPLAALGALALNLVSAQAEQYTMGNLRQTMLYLSRNLEASFTEYNNISKLMYTNGTMYNQLHEDLQREGSMPGFSQGVTINDFLKTILNTNRNIRSVFFVVNQTSEIYVKSNNALEFDKNNFLWRRWGREMEANPKQIHYFGVHSESYFIDSDTKVFTLARHFIDKTTAAHENPVIIGTLYIDVEVDAIMGQLSTIQLNPHDSIHVLNAEQQVIIGSRQEGGGQTAPQSSSTDTTEESVFMQFPIQGTDMILTGQFLRKDLLPALLQFRNLTGIIVACSILFLIMLSIVFSRRFTRPVREVIHYMSKAESGNLDMQVPVHSKDELGQLARGFNRLLDRLGEFIKVAYLAEIKQKRAELNALKSQIRPHYLYNTLEVIRMSAVANEDRPVADMIHSLSEQLNYVLDYGENFVSLEQELDHVRHYFKLIRIRTEDAIQLEINMDEAVQEDWRIVKMSIQPLVENAVQHGIWPRASRGRIRIELHSEDEGRNLAVTVTDDGVGMEEARLTELMDHLRKEAGTEHMRKHHGLKNVNDRLKSLFQGNPGLEIRSKEHVGTSVSFVIPRAGKENGHAESYAG
jgi:two-component system sensor histidine kinase YesM